MQLRFFFACGPGDIIKAHEDWRSGVSHAGQMSLTFSSDFEQFCTDVNAAAYLISSSSPAQMLVDNEFKVENRPKRTASGARYHLEELRYGLGLALSAKRFNASHAFLQSGSTNYFVMSAFRLLGIKVIPIMHNTLWPAGSPPTSFIARTILYLDALFFRWFASATLGVSPECLRQVTAVCGHRHCPLYPFTIQFEQSLFPVTAPPAGNKFKLLFAGRIAENKGVFDLLKIMRLVEENYPDQVTLDICGDGPDLEALRAQSGDLSKVVKIHGWTEPKALRSLLIESHASIVPTKSGFAEGMAMTVIEPILLGRPVITNSVVPALEVLRSACVEARTDDVESYADSIITLAKSPEAYQALIKECSPLRTQFFDRSRSSQAALTKAIS